MGVTPARHFREQARVEAEKEKGFKQNESKFTEFDMGCSSGQISACNSLGEWYSLMRQDFRKASELYTTACFEHKYPQACLNLGQMLLTGKVDVAPDERVALRAFTLGCEAGNADACANAGRILLAQAVGPAPPASGAGNAATYAEMSRASGHGARPLAPLQAPDLALTAERLLRHGCEVGTSTTNAKCCGMLAAMHMSPRFNTTAGMRRMPGEEMVSLLHTACSGEHAPACSKLAALYRRGGALELGIVMPKDDAAADKYDTQSLRWLGLSESRAQREMDRRKGL